jgi:hypothetical protein
VAYLVDPGQESLEGFFPLSYCGEAGVFIDKRLSSDNSVTVPTSNPAGKPVDEIIELAIWDSTINPCEN